MLPAYSLRCQHSYYVLRQDMLGNLKDQLVAQLNDPATNWRVSNLRGS